MEGLILLALAVVGVIVVGGILGLFAFMRTFGQRSELDAQRTVMRQLVERLTRLERIVGGGGTQAPPAAPPAEAKAPTAPAAGVTPAAAGYTAGRGEAVPEKAPAPAGVAPATPPPTVRTPTPPPVPTSLFAPGAQGSAGAGENWAQCERNLGMKWIAYAGAVVLFFATVFFVKYAFDNGWIGPTARIAMGIVFGIVLLVAGDGSIRRKMAPLGQALMGAGLAVLYSSLFASFKLYHLMPQTMAFGAMVAVTAAGMTLAILHNAQAICIIAIVGGFATPVLLSTGVDARDALFTYVIMLDLGALAVATFRRWRAFDILAFAGTVILYGGWYEQFYKPEALMPAMLWLGAFCVLFLVIPVVYSLRLRSSLATYMLVLALANAGFGSVIAYKVLYPAHMQALGFLSLAAAAAYLVLATVVRKRTPGDATGLFGFVALSMMFLTLAVPLELGMNGILLAWAAEGLPLLYIGYKAKYTPARVGAFVILGIAFWRLIFVNWPHHSMLFVPFWNVKFGAAICVPLAAGIFAVIHHTRKSAQTAWDIGLKVAAAVAGGFIATILVDRELAGWLTFKADEAWANRIYVPGCASLAVWTAGALLFLAAGAGAKVRAACIAGAVLLFIAIMNIFGLYDEQLVKTYRPFANLRFAVSAAVVAAVFIYGRAFVATAKAMWAERKAAGHVFYWAGAVLLLVVLSVEPYNYATWTIENSEKAEWAGQMALSVVWSAYAAAALVMGFWKRTRPLRFAALGLFALTVIKVAVIDMGNLSLLYRIVSFMVLGLLMVAASYLYHRVERKIANFFGEGK